jgi:hypothetical protein
MSHSDRFTDTGSTSAFYQGVESERERIIRLLEQKADSFQAMRPEFYKDIANKMDIRVQTIRSTIQLIKGEIK